MSRISGSYSRSPCGMAGADCLAALVEKECEAARRGAAKLGAGDVPATQSGRAARTGTDGRWCRRAREAVRRPRLTEDMARGSVGCVCERNSNGVQKDNRSQGRSRRTVAFYLGVVCVRSPSSGTFLRLKVGLLGAGGGYLLPLTQLEPRPQFNDISTSVTARLGVGFCASCSILTVYSLDVYSLDSMVWR
jgi:hypothetical protein